MKLQVKKKTKKKQGGEYKNWNTTGSQIADTDTLLVTCINDAKLERFRRQIQILFKLGHSSRPSWQCLLLKIQNKKKKIKYFVKWARELPMTCKQLGYKCACRRLVRYLRLRITWILVAIVHGYVSEVQYVDKVVYLGSLIVFVGSHINLWWKP